MFKTIYYYSSRDLCKGVTFGCAVAFGYSRNKDISLYTKEDPEELFPPDVNCEVSLFLKGNIRYWMNKKRVERKEIKKYLQNKKFHAMFIEKLEGK